MLFTLYIMFDIYNNFNILLHKLYSVTAAVFFLSVCIVCNASMVYAYFAFNLMVVVQEMLLFARSVLGR